MNSIRNLIIAGSIALVLLFTGIYFIGTYNTQNTLLNTYNMKIKDNQSEFDNMFKKIGQSVQVTKAQQDSIKEIIVANATARTTSGGDLMKMVTESIPNIDTKTFQNLQNIIVGSRDGFTFRQKELVGIAEEYNKNLSVFPRNIILGVLGFKKLDPLVITSSHTKEVFSSGEDNEVELKFK
jgi:hypothetical protein